MPTHPVTHRNNDKPTWEEAIHVTPVGSHRYSAFLQSEWCIGTVPHGGYTTAVLYRLATTHFAHSHASRYHEPATPISIQLTFLRRTSAGPAVLTVQDMKIGARTSTILVTLSQPRETKKNAASAADDNAELEVKVTGYITVSPASAEVGLSANTGWSLSPAAHPGSGVNGRVDLATLGQTGRDGEWMRLDAPYPQFRRATQQVELYGPDPALGRRPLVDQWARFRPYGNTEARWTNEAVAYLTDLFPMALDGLDSMASAASEEKSATHWYPTVTLNIDLKKRLPPQGVEWLYSRVQTKVVRDGRTDIDVVVLDEQGDVVALSTQVGLVLSASRNVGQRSKI